MMTYKGALLVWIVLLLPLLVSCLGDDGQTLRYSSRYAVVQENPRKSLFVRDDSVPKGYLISSPEIEGRADLKEGDCCLVEYRLNLNDAPEGGVLPAEVLACDTISMWKLAPLLTDTIDSIAGEDFPTLSFNKSLYLKGRYFLTVTFKGHQPTRQDILDFSYDPEGALQVGDNGVRVYHLFLRAYKDGGRDTIRTESLTQPNAFVIEDFVNQAGVVEKAVGLDSLRFVINYPKSFNTDSTGFIWSRTDTFSIYIN